MNLLLRLHADDNVLVALRAAPKGTQTENLTLKSDISLAHKVAARDIDEGAGVLKNGMVIGRATSAIKAGDHVHVHNLASNYTATYYRTEEVK